MGIHCQYIVDVVDAVACVPRLILQERGRYYCNNLLYMDYNYISNIVGGNVDYSDN